jgi:hypothetical protein
MLTSQSAFLTMAVLAGATSDGWAQTPGTPKVAITIQSLASVQPVDDSYVGSPYLDKGLGGVGPGLAAGLRVGAHRLDFAFEFSTAAVKVRQTGRLVSGTAVGQLRDSLVSFLAGASVWSSAQGAVVPLAGVSFVAGEPAQDGVPIDARSDPAAHENNGSLAFTGGVDVVRRLAGRFGLIASARYSALPRSRRAAELGVSAHVFRFGAGLRIGLPN